MAATKTKAQTAKKEAGKRAMDFLVDFMKKNPRAVYADAAEAARRAGHTIYPIMWGRAGVMLGRVKARPRGTGKAAAATARAKSESTPTPRAAKAERAPERPARNGWTSRSQGGVELQIPSEDLSTWQALVEQVNQGAHMSLQFAGQGWKLVTSR